VRPRRCVATTERWCFNCWSTVGTQLCDGCVVGMLGVLVVEFPALYRSQDAACLCLCLYRFVSVCIGLYRFVSVCVGLYRFVSVCIGLYLFVLCLNARTKGGIKRLTRYFNVIPLMFRETPDGRHRRRFPSALPTQQNHRAHRIVRRLCEHDGQNNRRTRHGQIRGHCPQLVHRHDERQPGLFPPCPRGVGEISPATPRLHRRRRVFLRCPPQW
jgi:hypothetical protein